MTWPAPQSADIVWCYVPYEYPDGTVSLVRHPALIVAVDDTHSTVQVAVMGGTSYRKSEWAQVKRARKAWDLLLESKDPWFTATGLSNDTLFHMQRRYVLPYNAEHFYAPANGNPKMGRLDGSHMALRDKLQRAMAAAREENANRSH